MSERKIALFDIDDTIYNGGIIFPLMESEAENGLLPRERVDEVYECRSAYKRAEMTYEEQSKRVVSIWAEGLRGVSYEAVANHAEEFIKHDLNKFYEYTPRLLDLFKETHDTVIITNEPQFVAVPVLKLFGFSSSISTFFEVEDGVLTGAITRFNSTQNDKGEAVREAFEGRLKNGSYAFGDSISDLQMLEHVEYPVCVNANEELKAVAIARGWPLTNPTTILDVVSETLNKSG